MVYVESENWRTLPVHSKLSNPRVQYKWQSFACSILGASITPIRLAYVSLLRDAGLTAPLPVYVKGSRAIVAIVASIIFLVMTRFSLFLKNIFLARNLSVYWLTIKPYQDTAAAETISAGISTCVLLYNMCCANVLHIHWISVAVIIQFPHTKCSTWVECSAVHSLLIHMCGSCHPIAELPRATHATS